MSRPRCCKLRLGRFPLDRKSTRLNSSHVAISYAVFCLKKKTPYTVKSSQGETVRADDLQSLTLGHSETRRSFIWLYVILFFADLSLGFIQPTLSLYATSLGASLFLVSVITSTVGVTRIFGQPFF